ncbi:hypothetical protein [Streptantibioticus ferralitis]|uniref:Uncharacterized protein n=1 Tax=Streptantibioticus ferralitis TaxID=236510 RepID=A0ABT5YS75_9ACTN|nr:hypothetical protein [Streptantibioticus ferralitis]MDF2254399.1 hypothetical protein [Streptantibioticus ferralitis]
MTTFFHEVGECDACSQDGFGVQGSVAGSQPGERIQSCESRKRGALDVGQILAVAVQICLAKVIAVDPRPVGESDGVT